MYKKILLAADGSEHSIRAAKQAILLASLQGDAEIEVLFVIDFDQSKTDVIHHADSSSIQIGRKKRLQPIETLLQQANVLYKITMKHGEPGPVIVMYANKYQPDIVVIGSRGLNGLQQMVLGSVSHKVAKRVQSPVLIVK